MTMPLITYIRGYKKRAIAKIMFETSAIFYDSLKGYFSEVRNFFTRCLAKIPRKSLENIE